MNHFDVLIIGNGIIGLSTAFALFKKNPRIKIGIIGPKSREGGASFAAGAMLNCFAEAITQTFQTVPNQTKFEMCYRALKMWPEWIETINELLPFEDRLAIAQGTYVILNSRSGQLDTDHFLSIIDALNRYQQAYEEINPTELKEINPLQSCRPLRVISIPEEGCISSHKVLAALEQILRNTTFIHDTADRILTKSGTAESVRLVSGRIISADKILLANGAFSQNILDKLPELRFLTPRIFAGVGYSLLVEQNQESPIRHVIRTPNRAGACGLHALPRSSETLYIGASNDLFFTPHSVPKIGMLNFLMECAIQQIDQQLTRSKLLGIQVGNRPASIDSFPLIGELSIKNLFLLTGTYRDGFHQSPLLAKHMAALLTGEDGIISDIFRPERPLIQVKNRKESIDEYMSHFQGSSYEHNLLLPTGILTDQEYLRLIRERIERLYDMLRTDYGFPPDLLFMFDLDAENRSNIETIRSYFQVMKFQQAESNFARTK